MIKPEVLKILCCPACQCDLAYNERNNTLTCTKCGTVYDVKDDIPILLPKNDGK